MSKIEWTDITINPIKAVRKDTGKIGWHCVKVSPECTHCYAEAMNKRNMPGCGTGLPYTVGTTDLVTMYLDMKPFEKLARMKARKKVFVCSMTDMFGEFVPDSFIFEMFGQFLRLQQHTFQLLTKRPERMSKSVPLMPLPNVWMGVTAGDQKRADERIPWLLRTPAAKRFLSYEPALGPVRLWKLASLDYHENTIGYETYPLAGLQAVSDCDWKHSKLDWVISGGESGPHARPTPTDWFRAIRDQCVAANVAYFHKQNGEWCPFGQASPGHANALVKIGKKKAGRLLDGREWSQFPEVKP